MENGLVITFLQVEGISVLRINLRRMEIFQRVYENNSVSDAARVLNITQPSVSRMLKEFEKDLGFKLFELYRGRIHSTPEADRLHRESSPVFKQVEHVSRIAEQLKGGHEELIRVSVDSYFCFDVLPKVALRFSREFPQIDLQLSIRSLPDQRSALARGEIDLGIAAIDDPELGFGQKPLGDGVFVCLVPEDSRLADANVVRAKDLTQRGRVKWEGGGLPVNTLLENILSDFDNENSIKTSSMQLAARIASLDQEVVAVDLFTAINSSQGSVIKPFETCLNFKIGCEYLETRPLSKFQNIFLNYFGESLAGFMKAHNVY